MLANQQLVDPAKYSAEDGINNPASSIKASTVYKMPFTTPITNKVDTTSIASIIKESLKLAKSVGPQKFIEQVDKEIFECFKKIASVFNMTLANGTEIPEIIDSLKQNGRITEDVSAKLLDLLLIIDGLKFQNEILPEDIELLSNIAEDLEKAKIMYPEDYSSNFPYSYIHVARIKTLNGSTIVP